MLRKCAGIATLVAGVTAATMGAEKKFDLYGFMDLTLNRLVVEDNNPLMTEGFDNDWRFRVGNVQLYTDFQPHNRVRALIETGFHWQPHGEYDPGTLYRFEHPLFGTIITNDLSTIIPTNTTPIDNPETHSNTLNLTARGEVPLVNVALHRAWAEYNFNQYVNIRAGKFITPAGIWNVDHGSPVIVTVRQPFQTGMIEVFPKSQSGIMTLGSTYIGDYDLDYKLYLSSGRDVQSIREPKDIAVGGNLKFKAVDAGVEVGLSAYTGLERAEDRYTVIGLEPNSDGITEMTDSIFVKMKSREHCFGLDAKWNYKGALLQGEFNFNKLKNLLNNNAETKVTAFYGLAGYKFRVNKKMSLMPYFLYENIAGDNAYDRDAKVAVNPVNIISTGFVDKLGTVCTGVNMNLFTNTNLKLEYAWLNFDKDGSTDKQNEASDFSVISLQLALAF